MSLPQFWWTDTKTWKTILYRGEEVHFVDLCKVFQETGAKLMQIWEEGILMGQDIRVKYDKIADDLINKDGKIIWSRSALQAWLRSYAELQSPLLLQAQMLSSAPSHEFYKAKGGGKDASGELVLCHWLQGAPNNGAATNVSAVWAKGPTRNGSIAHVRWATGMYSKMGKGHRHVQINKPMHYHFVWS
ncbi:hypothetical protein EDD16DRAFT_1527307 [Pisolithus croceorrhizus]|nr:hypothetical protein EDD16DRAFT_1527307 [Pisolithus croceorrhizus]